MKSWKDILIRPETTVLEAMKVIDKEALQIALVTDAQGKLLGTVTDGDVRRGILNAVTLDSPVSSVMNPKPQTVRMNMPNHEILKIMQSKNISRVPILNSEGIVVGLKKLDEMIQVPKIKENPVVLMAGGLGSRLGDLTQNCPKPMLKVGGKPILEIILENFIEHGFHQFHISVNYMAEMIEEYFGNGSKWGVEINYIRETQRMGTAGSLSLLSHRPELPVIVMNGDLLTKVNFSRLIEHHYKTASAATMCVRQYDFQVPFGVVEMKDDEIKRIIEKPRHSFFVSAGVYVLSPEVFKEIPKESSTDMPNIFEKMIEKKSKTSVFPIHEYWLDIGRKDDFEKANTEFQ